MKNLFIIFLFLSSCSLHTLGEKEKSGEPKWLPHYTYVIDRSFTNDEIGQIVDAIEEWNEKSNHAFTWNINIVNEQHLNLDNSYDEFGNIYINKLKISDSGHAWWNLMAERDRAEITRSAVIDINPNLGEVLYTVALHEIGHTFNLAHNNVPYSIMQPASGEKAVSKYDIEMMCQNYNCIPDTSKCVH